MVVNILRRLFLLQDLILLKNRCRYPIPYKYRYPTREFIFHFSMLEISSYMNFRAGMFSPCEILKYITSISHCNPNICSIYTICIFATFIPQLLRELAFSSFYLLQKFLTGRVNALKTRKLLLDTICQGIITYKKA